MKKNGFSMLMSAWLLFALAAVSFAQNPVGDDVAAGSLNGATPSYADAAPVGLDNSQAASINAVTSSTILDFPANADSSRAIFAGSGNSSPKGASNGVVSSTSHPSNGLQSDVATIDGLDSLPTFSGAFINQAGPKLGNMFGFTMVGNHPLVGGTTSIPAQITTVNLRLLNSDGSFRVTIPFSFKDLVANSPNYEGSNYRSGSQLQYADAVHRAQFYNAKAENWHTVLSPTFVNEVTMTIPRFVNVRFADGSVKKVQNYFFGTAPDGSHFIELLDLYFNAVWQNQAIADINSGNFTTNAISHTLFPNTFLFSINNQGQFSGCCVLGFHTYFFDPGAVPQPRWVTQFASWISPGLFGAGFQDVTALSHETAEIFGNPFLSNATASWQFPGVAANAKVCQGNLEEGDPIEVLPTATIPMKLKNQSQTFTYHPQIIPLLQWFEMGKTSSAIDGAFSFPDETTLPHSALPCPQ